MKYRYIGILGETVGCFSSYEEAYAYIQSIPGMFGIILDRVLTPQETIEHAFGVPDDDEPVFPLVKLAPYVAA